MDKIVIASGYFNPLHGGHIDYLMAAARLGDLIVIVNNDQQQIIKNGSIYMTQEERLKIVSTLKPVSTAILSIDPDLTVKRTLMKVIRALGLPKNSNELILANGGDVIDGTMCREAGVCKRWGIEMVFGVGGPKTNSSSELRRKG